jgi:F-box and leucine-rich repeat protein GRR1
MAIYKHHAPSNTSFSDEEDYEQPSQSRYTYRDNVDNQHLVVTPAQWTARQPPMAISHSSSSQSSPITQLPPEVIIHIFKHLHLPKDIYNALRVCRTWCECSVELLWHRPSFGKTTTLNKVIRVLSSSDQTFVYDHFIRRLNFLPLAKDLRDDDLSVLACCERLERLTMIGCENISGVTLSRVLPSFPNLVACDLTGVTHTDNAAIISLARAAKRLQGINLSGCKEVSDDGVIALAENCPFLRRVKLSGLERLTDNPVSALAKHCPLLLEIDLNQCQLITDISIRDIWTHSSHMREMRLSHCAALTDAAFPAPTRRDYIPSDAPNPFPLSTSLTSNALPPLTLSRSFDQLRMLDLTACTLITDDAIEGVISHAPKIRNLVLSKCVLLTDRSVEVICRLGRSLHYIHMGHAAKITDRSIRALARSCTRLRYIDFASKFKFPFQ